MFLLVSPSFSASVQHHTIVSTPHFKTCVTEFYESIQILVLKKKKKKQGNLQLHNQIPSAGKYDGSQGVWKGKAKKLSRSRAPGQSKSCQVRG